VVLVTRFGAHRIGREFPKLLRAVRDEGLAVAWVCDPMHGNTETVVPTGGAWAGKSVKTRKFAHVLAEVEQAIEIHRTERTQLAGVHVELTGENVTECTGGARGLTDDDLSRAYRSHVDPRLNYEQALELAMLIARRYRTLASVHSVHVGARSSSHPSITHNWGGKPLNDRICGADSWAQYLEPLQVRNLGFGWDRIENVLWRVYHDELDGISPEKIIINIGTNNLHLNTDLEIISGLKFLVDAIKIRQPRAKIYLLGLYPCRDKEARILQLNKGIQLMAKANGVAYADLGTKLLLPTGKIDEKLFSDGLHPNADGYQLLGKALANALNPPKK
jgi:lysophospholipase L1-like esterase